MTDRELLELAAKAAGIEYQGIDNRFGVYLLWDDPRDKSYWNPLTDDGDALRLAVKLDMNISCNGDCCSATEGITEVLTFDELPEDYGNDPYAATRRAIVRAAAEIGKEKP